LAKIKRTAIEKVNEKLQNVLEKLQNVLEKNLGLKFLFIIHDTLNANNLDKDFYYNLTPGEVSKFKFAKITSCDVKRSFTKYKNILRSDRISFIFENFKQHIIVLCNTLE